MTNGAALPENGFVFLSMTAEIRTAAIPTKYIIGAIQPPAEKFPVTE